MTWLLRDLTKIESRCIFRHNFNPREGSKMGLDMNLSEKHYVKQWDHISAERQWDVKVTRGGKPVNLGNISHVECDVGYWRKANAIHQWFVLNVQNGEDDCRTAWVSRRQLQELRDLVQEVIDDPEKAMDLLPPQSGFFFGSTEIDEWYFEDLRLTIEILDPILAKPEEECGEFYYHSSW